MNGFDVVSVEPMSGFDVVSTEPSDGITTIDPTIGADGLPTAGDVLINGQPSNNTPISEPNPLQKSANLVADTAISAAQGALEFGNLPFQALDAIPNLIADNISGSSVDSFSRSNERAIRALDSLKSTDNKITKILGQGAEFGVGGGTFRLGINGLAKFAKLDPVTFNSKVERIIDAGAGMAGSVAEEVFGQGPIGNLVVSLIAGLGIGGSTNMLKRLTGGEMLTKAETIVSSILQDIFKRDPQAKTNINETLKASRESGTSATIGQAGQNPDLLAIDSSIAARVHASASRDTALLRENLSRLEANARDVTGTSNIDTQSVKLLAENTLAGITEDLTAISAGAMSIIEKRASTLDANLETTSSIGRDVTEKIDTFLDDKISDAYTAASEGSFVPDSFKGDVKGIIKDGSKTETGERSSLARQFKRDFVRRVKPKALEIDPITPENILGFAKKAASLASRESRRDGGDPIEAKAMRGISDGLYEYLDSFGGEYSYAREVKASVEKLRKESMLTRFNETDRFGVLKRTPEEFNKAFIDVSPSTARKTMQVATDAGQADAFRKSVRDNLALSIYTLATRNGKVNPAIILRQIRRKKDVIGIYGLSNEFKTTEAIIQSAERTIEESNIALKDLNKTALSKVVKATNLPRFIRDDIANGSVNKTNAELETQELKDAHKSLVVDSLINDAIRTNNTNLIDPTATQKIFADKTTRLALIRFLGKKHFDALASIANEAAKFRTTVSGGQSGSIPTGVSPEKVRRFMFGRIRAALRGFISPDFTAIEIGNFTLTNKGNKQVLKLFEEIKYNSEAAIILAKKMETDKEFRDSILSLLRPINPLVTQGDSAVQSAHDAINNTIESTLNMTGFNQ